MTIIIYVPNYLPICLFICLSSNVSEIMVLNLRLKPEPYTSKILSLAQRTTDTIPPPPVI